MAVDQFPANTGGLSFETIYAAAEAEGNDAVFAPIAKFVLIEQAEQFED